MSLAELPLEILDQHELATILPAFNADIAWELGEILRANALKFPKPVLISITAANGLVLFQTATRPGVTLDNQSWVDRKKRVVTYFDTSSYYMGVKLRKDGKTLEEIYGKSEKDYAPHGGAFPLRVRGVEGIVGVVVVSGLHQKEDHLVCVDSLKEYIEKITGEIKQKPE